jgi:uncharacterized protein (DUF779 family)
MLSRSPHAYHARMRVNVTESAAGVVRHVQAEGRDNLVMVLSNGCCDSTAPYLYDNYMVEAGSEPVGEIEGVTVLAPEWLRKLYPDDMLTVDVEQGVLDDSFSLETEFDCRFVLRAPVAEEKR